MTHEIVIEVNEDNMDSSPEEMIESEIESEVESDSDIEIVDQPIIVIDDIPGAPPGTSDLALEVEQEDDELNVEDASKSPLGVVTPKSKWDWKASFPNGFIDWIKERHLDTPKHTGYDLGGLERALAYMQRLDNEISKAMREDIDGHLNAAVVDKTRSEIEKGIDALEKRIDNVKDSKKKKKASDPEGRIIKEAQQSPGIQSGIQITVSLLIATLARACINGTVSAGHDIEDLFAKACKKFKLDEREKYELRQMIFDMNFPIRFDRLSLVGEETDESSEDNGDWAANYGGKNQ